MSQETYSQSIGPEKLTFNWPHSHFLMMLICTVFVIIPVSIKETVVLQNMFWKTGFSLSSIFFVFAFWVIKFLLLKFTAPILFFLCNLYLIFHAFPLPRTCRAQSTQKTFQCCWLTFRSGVILSQNSGVSAKGFVSVRFSLLFFFHFVI